MEVVKELEAQCWEALEQLEAAQIKYNQLKEDLAKAREAAKS